MAYQDGYPARRASSLGILLTSRDTVPVATAAAGTLLLTTALAQPLTPRLPNFEFSYSPAPAMSHVWQAIIIALLVAGAAGALLWSWRHILGLGTVLICGISAAALLINLLVLNPAVSVLDLMTDRGNWALYATLFVLPFLACGATILQAIAPGNGLAGGILLATGAGGYLFYLQEMYYYLQYPAQGPAPGRAMFIGMLGSAVVLVAGVLAHAASSGSGWQVSRGTVRAARLAATGGAIAVVVGNFYVAFFEMKTSTETGSHFLLYVVSTFIFVAAVPSVLALCASRSLASGRDPGRRWAAGVLITAAFLTLVYFMTSHVFGWMVPLHGIPGFYLDASDIAVAGGIAMGFAAVLLLASRPAGPARPAPAGLAAGQLPADELPADQPPAATRSETTRFLCTAPHLDDRYARRVIEDVAGAPHRAVVPSLGLDMSIVLRHCFAARRRQIIRDTLIAAIVVSFLPVLLDYHHLATVRDILLLFVVAAAIAFADRWISRYLVTRGLTRDAFGADPGPWVSAAEQERIAEVLASEDGNVSVYGIYNPFVGSGVARGGWSFAVNLARGKETPGGQLRLEPKPFEVEEFYQAVHRDIGALGLAGALIENRLLVDGQSIRDDTRFLPDRAARPVTTIGPVPLRELERAPELVNRPYLCARVQGWDGELILSVFVHFTKRGAALLAEVQHYLLAPVLPEYRQADRLAGMSWSQRLTGELRSGPRAVTGTVLRAPFRLGRLLIRMSMRWNGERSALRRIAADPEYNFGATTSVRELAQSDSYRRYFQQVDRDLNTKLIDRQLLDTIMEFLDAHNIDISQFEEQRATILNNGLLVSGGEFKAESVAVGERARAAATHFTQGVQALRGQGGDSA